MKLKDYLSKKGKAPKGHIEDWLTLCTLDVTSGSLWAGDPQLANADDGCVTKVPSGPYVVEGMVRVEGRSRYVSRLRVRLQSEKDPKTGKELGTTGTDSAMIGVCDIKAFDKACKHGSGDKIQAEIEKQTDDCCGVIDLKKFPGAIMPFVPIGSDGGGPVLALLSGRKRVGIELSFVAEPSDRKQVKVKSSLLGSDRDGFITRVMADGMEASFWVGGKLRAGEKLFIWSTAKTGLIEYQVRQSGGRAVTKWSPLKKNDDQFCAFETLGVGTYEIVFRIGKDLYSAVKVELA